MTAEICKNGATTLIVLHDFGYAGHVTIFIGECLLLTACGLVVWLGLGLDLVSGWLAANWAAWLPGTCQVGRLVRRPGGPPRQMLKEGVERRRGPLARERALLG